MASQYLATKLRVIDDPLQLARVAYALHVTDHPSKDEALHILHSMRRESKTPFINYISFENNSATWEIELTTLVPSTQK